MISELVKANRSCRRFYEDHRVELKTLEELVDLARLSASGANLQPLKYILACQPDVNAEIFSCLV
jgi:nitroreductase